MKNILLTREQANKLTQKAVDKILEDEDGAEGILALLESAEIIDEPELQGE